MEAVEQGDERRRRVVFLAADLASGGGVNRVIRDLASLLAERPDLRVDVLSARGDGPPSFPFPPSIRVEQHERAGLFRYMQLLWKLRRSRPDFVIGPWAQDNILLILMFLFSPTKIVAVEHAPWHLQDRLVRAVRRLVYPFAWRVVVLNARELDHYRAFLSNVRQIPNPVAPARASASREKLVLAVGHLTELKNFADAIRAMARSGLEQRGWSLAIIGAGPQQAGLERLISELWLSSTAIHPPTPDLASWYARASLMLVTSKAEVFSLVLAEGMAAGVVPLAYAADGPAFILRDFPGQLVPIGDVDALASRLAAVANDPDPPRLGDQMRAEVRARFAPQAIADAWHRLFAEEHQHLLSTGSPEVTGSESERSGDERARSARTILSLAAAGGCR